MSASWLAESFTALYRASTPSTPTTLRGAASMPDSCQFLVSTTVKKKRTKAPKTATQTGERKGWKRDGSRDAPGHADKDHKLANRSWKMKPNLRALRDSVLQLSAVSDLALLCPMAVGAN